jgi:DNA polymerase III epsilon subunit-like protein
MNNIIIVFDTETTGFSPEKNEIVQLSYILYDLDKQTVLYATKLEDDIVNINGKIPKETSDVHGITKDMTLDKRPIKDHIDEFIRYCEEAGKFVGHNIKFDIQMITGQIRKIMQQYPDEAERYSNFLSKFAMINNMLPDAAYCTMNQSKEICAYLKGTKKLKAEKLMEVHRLLFNQDVKGQLHNALVDISVTLRVYLKLTANLDICASMERTPVPSSSVNNNNEICNLINPVDSIEPVKNVNYSGELISGFAVIPEGLNEETVTVKTEARKMAEKIVSNVLSQAYTSISVCSKTITKDNEVTDEVCKVVREKPIISKFSKGFMSNIMQSVTRKNKVVPLGGRRKALRKRKSRKIKKYRKRT